MLKSADAQVASRKWHSVQVALRICAFPTLDVKNGVPTVGDTGSGSAACEASGGRMTVHGLQLRFQNAKEKRCLRRSAVRTACGEAWAGCSPASPGGVGGLVRVCSESRAPDLATLSPALPVFALHGTDVPGQGGRQQLVQRLSHRPVLIQKEVGPTGEARSLST